MKKIIPLAVKCWFKKWQLTWWFHFAHHPLCERFEDHVWHIGPLIVCQGCFLITTGTISGFILFLLFQIEMGIINWLIFAFLVILPSFIVEFFDFFKAHRSFKRITRFLLGIGLGGLWWAILIIDTLEKLIASLLAIIFFVTFKSIRNKRLKGVDVCQGCPELEKGIICSGLIHKARAMREYSEYATELYYDRLKSKIVLKEKKNFN